MLGCVLAAFREAAHAGFGTRDPDSIQISNPSEPLESHSIRIFLDSLARFKQVVILIFDQFEELFSLHPAAWEKREDLFQQLAEVMENDSHLKIVLVIREGTVVHEGPASEIDESRVLDLVMEGRAA